MKHEETIVALSTPRGNSGIAVVRVSGPEAIDCVDRLWESNESLRVQKSHTAKVGFLRELKTGERIDQVVVTVFRAPHSYTGEDVVEISCHGSPYLASLIIENLLQTGARLAEPGEFTKRAFLNGKIDLVQAEAVAALIEARTKASVRSALNQLSGSFSQRLAEIQRKIIDMLANLELELDFVEDDVEIRSLELIGKDIVSVQNEIESVLATFGKGRFLQEGIRVVLTGKPNVGKSSLLNAFIGFERVIVDETPGTTRDVVEANLDIEGHLFRFADTAGMRMSNERVEKKGILRSREMAEKADLILVVLDATTGIQREDEFVLDEVQKVIEQRQGFAAEAALIWNKIDINPHPNEAVSVPWPVHCVSAKTGEGLKDLQQSLVRFAEGEDGKLFEDVMVTNLRHYELLKRAVHHLSDAKDSLDKGMSQEFLAVDVRLALDAIGEITGKTKSEDILNHIFSHFCIGK